MKQKIREQLLPMAEKDYQKFAATLLPGIDGILGVRLPKLRKLAKQIAKEDWYEYLNNTKTNNKQDLYFEEIMLEGMVIGYIAIEVEDILKYIEAFVPKINNWSVCDSFCIGLKFTKQNQERVWDFLQVYFSSEQAYEVRFGVVMLLDFYIEDWYIQRVLNILDAIHHDSYYVKMAVAWAVSICYIKFPDITMDYLQKNQLDDFTYNKSLMKISESLKIDQETKQLIKKMKRNRVK